MKRYNPDAPVPWRHFLLERCSEKEALYTFMGSTRDEKIEAKVAAIPEDMFEALLRFVTPVVRCPDYDGWPRAHSGIDNSVLDAFDFDLERAWQWRCQRLELYLAAVMKRLARRSDTKSEGMLTVTWMSLSSSDASCEACPDDEFSARGMSR